MSATRLRLAGRLAWALAELGVADPWHLLVQAAELDPTGWPERVRCAVLAWCARRAEPTAADLLAAASAALEAAEREREALAAELRRRHREEERGAWEATGFAAGGARAARGGRFGVSTGDSAIPGETRSQGRPDGVTHGGG